MSTQHGFKAEVQKLLELMIHSVYSDREVFLRELVSNAADALDKARFLGLTRSDLVDPVGGVPGIRIQVDADAKTVTIEDDGIGFTEAEAIDNLGTIAKSGTKAFLDQIGDEGKAPDLIGQFGLGFYSAFMVATEVVVESRSALPDEPAIRWTSKGQGSFEIETIEREHRGTSITLTLRDDADEFIEATRIQHIVRKHSNFLAWPIHVGEDQANSGKALWAEPPSQVSTEEANQFYKTVAMDWRDPALKVHLSVDSPFQYQALLFIPSERPFDLFNPEAPRGPRLYAKRVLIEEHARELLPDWLRFVRGVVDSEDISLNVSREMVQKTAVVQKIRRALTKRILKDLTKFSKREVEPTPEGETAPATYLDVWRQFGALLKEGYYHARDEWGEELLGLLRFNTTAHEDADGLVSLAEYKSSMPEGQDAIWYITGESREAALVSPHLEAFRKRGWTVLLLTETVDEWFVNALSEFDGLTVKSVARGDLELEDDDEDDAEKADLTGLTPWMQELYAGAVSAVRSSSRLTDSAAVLVDDEQGLSSNMERILRAANQDFAGGAQRILELNPKHPLIVNLAKLHAAEKTEDAGQLARLLLDDAMLLEGTVKDPASMGRRLQDLLTKASETALR